MISIFFTANSRHAQHNVADKDEGREWTDAMTAAHPDFCITGIAMHRETLSFGDECVREIRLY